MEGEELDRIAAYWQRITPDAHSVYEVLDEVPQLRAEVERLKRDVSEAYRFGDAICERLTKERDEALRVRDLAREASNRDLDAKRAAEAALTQAHDQIRDMADLSHEGELRQRAEKAEARVTSIGEQLEADRTAVADCMRAANQAIDSRHWLTEGRGSYEWDDDRWHDEFRAAALEIKAALGPLTKIAANWKDCPQTSEQVAQARIDWQVRATKAEAELAEVYAGLEKAGWREVHQYQATPDYLELAMRSSQTRWWHNPAIGKVEAELNRIRDEANRAISDAMQAVIDRTKTEAELAEARKALGRIRMLGADASISPEDECRKVQEIAHAALLRGEGSKL